MWYLLRYGILSVGACCISHSVNVDDYLGRMTVVQFLIETESLTGPRPVGRLTADRRPHVLVSLSTSITSVDHPSPVQRISSALPPKA